MIARPRRFVLAAASTAAVCVLGCTEPVRGDADRGDSEPAGGDGALDVVAELREERVASGLSVLASAVYFDAVTGERAPVPTGAYFRLEGPGQPVEGGVRLGDPGRESLYGELLPDRPGQWTMTFDADGEGGVPSEVLGEVEVVEAARITPLVTNVGFDAEATLPIPERRDLIGGIQHVGFAQLLGPDGRMLGGRGAATLSGDLGPLAGGVDVLFTYGQTGVTQGHTDLDGALSVQLDGRTVAGPELVNHPLDDLDGYALRVFADERLVIEIVAPDGTFVEPGFGLDEGVRGIGPIPWLAAIDGGLPTEEEAPNGWSFDLDPSGPEHRVRFEVGTLVAEVPMRGRVEIHRD